MPPAVDVQTLRPVAGEVWRWTDAAPGEGLVPMFTALGSSGLLTAQDRDEVWRVSSLLVDLDPSLSWRKGHGTVVVDVPLRGEWAGQVNVADPRLAVLGHAGPWTARVGGIAPWGRIGWPFSWGDWRVDGSASYAGRWLAATVGGSHGEAGTVARAALGARWRAVTVELAGSRGGNDGFLQSGEVTVAARTTTRSVTLVPFLSAGFLTTPGTPALRAGVTLAPPPRSPPVPATVPVPAEPLPVAEPTVPVEPPVPVAEPTVTVEPTPVAEPHIVRARIEQHPACLPRADEQVVVERMTQKAVDYLRSRGATDAGIEVVLLECAPRRAVDLVIIEVR